MGGVLTSAGGSALSMQASCASLPSPEWTQPLSTSISGASAQQNGLVSQELMQTDVHNALSFEVSHIRVALELAVPDACSIA